MTAFLRSVVAPVFVTANTLDLIVPMDIAVGDLAVAFMAGYSSLSTSPSFTTNILPLGGGSSAWSGSFIGATNLGLEDSICQQRPRVITSCGDAGATLRITGAGGGNAWERMVAFLAVWGDAGPINAVDANNSSSVAGGGGGTITTGAPTASVGGLVIDLWNPARRSCVVSSYSDGAEEIAQYTDAQVSLAASWLLASANPQAARTASLSAVGSASDRDLTASTTYALGDGAPGAPCNGGWTVGTT